MKILLITGDHPRHIFFIDSLKKNFDHVKNIIVKRESFKKPNIKKIDKKNKKLYEKHFKDREKEEIKYFRKKSHTFDLKIKQSEINGLKLLNYVKLYKPNIVITFGIGIIKERIIKKLPKNTLNFHLGLSPKYRGTATLFWPFYFLEPQYCGFTFHKLDKDPDSGDILHQNVPRLKRGDKIHTVACKTIKKGIKDIIAILKLIDNKKKKFLYVKQKFSGKNFLKSDFKAQHLELIYKFYKNNIVDMYLAGKLVKKKPRLIKFF
jgi:methionyl-tRNA formyltransferase